MKSSRTAFVLLAAIALCTHAAADNALHRRQVYGLLWSRAINTSVQTVPDLLQPRWQSNEYGGAALHAPSGLIFVASRDQNLHALRPDGQTEWSFAADGALSSVPVVGQTWVYVGADDAKLYALDPTTGALGWKQQVDAEITGPVRIVNDRLYFSTALDTVYCYDAASGTYRWHVRHRQPLGITLHGQATPAVATTLIEGTPTQVVAMGYADGSVAVFDADNGRERWRHQLGEGEAFYDVDADPVIVDDVLFAAAFSGKLAALKLIDGQPIWTLNEPEISRLSRKGPFLVAAGPGKVLGIDLLTGRVLWRFKFGKGEPSRPVFDRDYVLFTTNRGPMYVLDLYSGEPLQAFGSPLGMAAEPAVNQDLVVVLSRSGWLFALSPRFGGLAQARP